jgi:hypothetical protein
MPACQPTPYSGFNLERRNKRAGDCNGQTGSSRALRCGDGSRHRWCRFCVLQKPILGAADSEYWHCLSIRNFLFDIPLASMNKARGEHSAGPELSRWQLTGTELEGLNTAPRSTALRALYNGPDDTR